MMMMMMMMMLEMHDVLASDIYLLGDPPNGVTTKVVLNTSI
jgi:hypothetical protein